MKHYLQFSDLGADEYAYLFERAALIKRKFKAYEKHHPLVDRTLAMIFEKASTRTRISFELAAMRLSADVINFTAEASSLKKGETLKDTARNLDVFAAEIAANGVWMQSYSLSGHSWPS